MLTQGSVGQGDAEMTAACDFFQASTSWAERNIALAVELTEVLGSQNPASSAPRPALPVVSTMGRSSAMRRGTEYRANPGCEVCHQNWGASYRLNVLRFQEVRSMIDSFIAPDSRYILVNIRFKLMLHA